MHLAIFSAFPLYPQTALPATPFAFNGEWPNLYPICPLPPYISLACGAKARSASKLRDLSVYASLRQAAGDSLGGQKRKNPLKKGLAGVEEAAQLSLTKPTLS